MTSMQLSSGDLVADRRADYAEMLFEGGEHAAAADLLAETLRLVPTWAAGWYRLGEMREAAGELVGAADAWTEALRLDPDDRLGASMKLGLIGAAHQIDAPPSAFVAALFDQYADRFDRSLVEKLAYRVPELIAQALADAGAGAFVHVVDLGCGTGLMGERLRHAASFIEGYDISAQMLKRAQAKGVYDRLTLQDLQTFDPGDLRADLVVAADVFLYVGALERVLAAAATVCTQGGLLAFSVEHYAGPEPLVLRPSRRYAHSERYLRDLLAASGFQIVSIEPAAIRMDRGEPIEGLIVVARREVDRESILETTIVQPPASLEALN
ncbi:methyltransferase [Aquibium sp. LZ166]|uniref:Methyltransferase n=1 Tax=Aquibium pacificus TaxID=3153579 RepID=A0ABV3SC90_9HYPH